MVEKVLGVLEFALRPPNWVWGKTPEAFDIWAFTSTRIANPYVMIPSGIDL